MFAAHFPDLDAQLGEWDERVGRAGGARANLRDSFKQELTKVGADKPPYELETLVEGFARITEARSLKDQLATRLPPMVEGVPALFVCFAKEPAAFASLSAAAGASGNVVVMEGAAYPSTKQKTIGEILEKLLQPLYGVVEKAQDWPSARNIAYTAKAVDEFPADEVRESIRDERVREQYVRVSGCPACGG
jgi:hypothetical protein